MTVISERDNMHKYRWLKFVEFLDMICRIGIVGITMTDTLDYKVYMLLELIYEKMYRLQFMDRDLTPLFEVDEKLR